MPVGGANGANRLSGNAITEAFVFGANAGRNAAKAALQRSGSGWSDQAAAPAIEMLRSARPSDARNVNADIADLQGLMADKVGPFRTQDKLGEAVAELERRSHELGDVPIAGPAGFDQILLDWLDLRNMLLVARSVAIPALARTESRGAHQREDHIGLDESWTLNQTVALAGDKLEIARVSLSSQKVSA
jgi:succinate dehydrogenase / fumarate reductase flavoprotein subunit